MCVMIGHFSGPYLTVQPSKLKTLFELKSSHSIWAQRYEKYLNTPVFLGPCDKFRNLGLSWLSSAFINNNQGELMMKK